jgi:glycosyltransferase involved in cell wall biosynthesis
VSKALRILMPSIYFPPRVGGIESHVYSLACELAARGHEILVVTTRTEPASPSNEMTDGVSVRRLTSFGKHSVGWTLSSVFSVPEVISAARRSDIIHCHTFAFALGGGIASSLWGVPLVITVHSSHFLRLVKKGWMRPVMRLLLRNSSALLSTSKEIDEIVADLVPGAFTQAIVNGIDTDRFRPVEAAFTKQSDQFLIVCPRRLVEKNGVEFLIRALALLKGKLNVKAYLTGDGPLRGRLEGLAAEIEVTDMVVFAGSVENPRMPAVYSSADLVVIPSLVEATSIAALEAMACERIVAASRVGGLPEIIDDRSGILFDSGSPEAIAEVIEKVAAGSDMSDMGREARRRVVANWSIKKMTDVHEELYLRLARGKGDA